jgi:hypothetical protein
VRKQVPRLPIEDKLRVVLGLLKGEISGPEAVAVVRDRQLGVVPAC